MKYCDKCGAKNPDEAKFCTKCGAKFAAPPVPERTVKTISPMAGSPPPAQPAATPPPTTPALAPAPTLSANIYYYLDDTNQPIGPHTIKDLANLQLEGQITATTLVASDGDEEWKPWQAFNQNSPGWAIQERTEANDASIPPSIAAGHSCVTRGTPPNTGKRVGNKIWKWRWGVLVLGTLLIGGFCLKVYLNEKHPVADLSCEENGHGSGSYSFAALHDGVRMGRIKEVIKSPDDAAFEFKPYLGNNIVFKGDMDCFISVSSKDRRSCIINVASPNYDPAGKVNPPLSALGVVALNDLGVVKTDKAKSGWINQEASLTFDDAGQSRKLLLKDICFWVNRGGKNWLSFSIGNTHEVNDAGKLGAEIPVNVDLARKGSSGVATIIVENKYAFHPRIKDDITLEFVADKSWVKASSSSAASQSDGYKPCSQSLVFALDNVSCIFRGTDIDSGTFEKLYLNGVEIPVLAKKIESGGYITTRDLGKIMIKPKGVIGSGAIQVYILPEQEKKLTDFLNGGDKDDHVEVSSKNGGVAVSQDDRPLYLTYSNEQNGFEIKYPRTWTISQKQLKGMVVGFVSPKVTDHDVFRSNVAITKTDLSKKPLTLDQYVTVTIKQMNKAFTNVVVMENSPVDLSGHPGKKIVIQAVGKAASVLAIYTFVNQTNAYNITYMGVAERYEKEAPIFKEMIDSLKISF